MDHADDEIPGENSDFEDYGEEFEGELVQGKDEISESEKQRRNKQERDEKFRQVLSERQELRRKNIFLQKKMIEFFKKRKMDHVLKEDPKGLDLESKYLKRLFELQELKNIVRVSKEEMEGRVAELKTETVKIEETVKVAEGNYYERQRNLAFAVTLKGDKKISIRVVSGFLATQAANSNEISRLRLAEIKEKRILVDKQNQLRTLNSLDHGLKRADYEILLMQHENTTKVLESREEEANKCVAKSSKVSSCLNKMQKKAEHAERELQLQQQRFSEMGSHLSEAIFRLQKLHKIRKDTKQHQIEVEKSSGLVTYPEMLDDFESGIGEIAALWQKLEDRNTSKSESDRYVRFNTPEDFPTR